MPSENLIYGRNSVREVLRAEKKPEKVLFVSGEKTPPLAEIFALAKKSGAVIQTVDRKRLDQMCGGQNHQGVAAVVPATQYSTVAAMLRSAEEKGEDPFLILLDGIEDPHNLGSIIRSAECAGAHGVIIPKNRAVGVTPTVVKVSSGAAEYMPVARVTNLNQTIEDLKKEGLWIAGADMDGESYSKAPLSGPIALVIGAEGAGISRLTREKCDFIVSLPVLGHIDSLNAAVAAGILIYEVRRRRDG